MLKIEDLQVEVDGHKVLDGLNLTVRAGEVHAIMGPNGSGKSTLSKVVAGHPAYHVVGGRILYEINGQMKDITTMSPDERAREGVFLALQYPTEVPGVSNLAFLRTAFNALCRHHGTSELDEAAFDRYLTQKMQMVEISPHFLDRPVNVGFSGGEKKRNEILQMAVLSPRLAFLDETDSGLDVDALRIVASGVNKMRSPHNAIVMITHYQRLLDYIVPDQVHILSGGKIVRSGDKNLALEVETRGYDWLSQPVMS